jgi:hypothetical protein
MAVLNVGAPDGQCVGAQTCVMFGGAQKLPRGRAHDHEQFNGWHTITGVIQLVGQSSRFWHTLAHVGHVEPVYTAPVQFALHLGVSVQVPFVQATVQFKGRQLGTQCWVHGSLAVRTQVQLGPLIAAVTGRIKHAAQRTRRRIFIAIVRKDSHAVYTETGQIEYPCCFMGRLDW